MNSHTRACRFVVRRHEVALVRSREATLGTHVARSAAGTVSRQTLCGFPVSGRVFADRPSPSSVDCPVCETRLEAL